MDPNRQSSNNSHPLDAQRIDVTRDASTGSRSSLFSTNYTMSNNIGTGRVLGNLYSYAGRRLEKTIGLLAHRAGLGPNTTYEKIQAIYDSDESRKLDTYASERADVSTFRLGY